ncbi:MAG: aldo/keto reductase [Planctomycetales bacterium]|nr:aldo/keto reductase [Planctomycetales bacterium]
MEYRLLGRTGVRVSPVCLGTMMFGGQTDETESTRIIHKAIDLGINFIDTADIYNAGQSEIVVGRALAGQRDKVVLATKGKNPMGDGPNQRGSSRLHLIQAVNDSLRRLNTDFIDVYYVHTPDYETPIDETLRALDDIVRLGKVRYIACSNFRTWRLMEAIWTSDKLNLHRFACVQPLYNICNRDVEVELLPMCREYKIGVVTYSPLARGILTGKYKAGQPFPEGSRAARNDKRMREAELRDDSFVAAGQITAHCQKRGVATSQFAVAWCLANPVVTSVILGPRTIEQFDDNFGGLNVVVTADDEKLIDGIVPPGEHTGKGYQDVAYPITGRGK